MDEQEIEAVLRTAPKGVDKKAVLADLAAIRRDKVRVSRSEIFNGAIGIAAPCFDNVHRVAGSIIVFGPDIRFDEQRIALAARSVCATQPARPFSALAHLALDSVATLLSRSL